MFKEFLLNPNKGLGLFEVGLPIAFCINLLQRGSQGEIKICFCQEDLFSGPIVVEESELGLELTFDPRSQRLQLIRINAGKIKLTYGGKTIFEPGRATMLKSISNLFGPSFPGVYDPETELFSVEYGGVCFQFAAGHSDLDDLEDISLVPNLPDVKQPLLIRSFVFQGESIRACSMPVLREFQHYYTPVEIDLQHGLHFIALNQRISYFDHVQHVLGVLGPPNKIFEHRTEDDMQGDMVAYCVFPYFYNYFDLGVSILFDGKTHRVSKFILNTNLIDRPDFGIWRKSNFSICVPGITGNFKITPETDLETLQEWLGPASGPIINSSEQNSIPPTKIYSYPHMLLEFAQVTKRICRVFILPEGPPHSQENTLSEESPQSDKFDNSPCLSAQQSHEILPPPLILQSHNSTGSIRSLSEWPIEINQDDHF